MFGKKKNDPSSSKKKKASLPKEEAPQEDLSIFEEDDDLDALLDSSGYHPEYGDLAPDDIKKLQEKEEEKPKKAEKKEKPSPPPLDLEETSLIPDEEISSKTKAEEKEKQADTPSSIRDIEEGLGVSDPNKEEEAPLPDASAERQAMRMHKAQEQIWKDLRDSIDMKGLVAMEVEKAKDEIKLAVEEIATFRNLEITKSEIATIAKECSDDMLGFGPLEPLIERDDIADIMINGPDLTYIEVNGKIEQADIKFRDNQHLTGICQRIVGAIGRRVDESSPICDARLPDGSRVNAIIKPLAVDGATLTIRKFKKEKLTLETLVGFNSLTPECAKMIMAIGRSRINILVSGGTGSGKTTMLNCLTRYIDSGERIITCEDACELQLQQPHVVRLETRPPNLEGVGEVTMRDLVKNCLRMRPERIIVGEVRGPEAFDLLQAMNTGHDGSMGTVHANNPREAISRMENMIAMAGLNLSPTAVREQIASAVNVIIQIQRLRDGSRKVTHISEITGMEGEVVTMQDLFVLEHQGEDDQGNLVCTQKPTGIRPQFFDRTRQYRVDNLVMEAMEGAFTE